MTKISLKKFIQNRKNKQLFSSLAFVLVITVGWLFPVLGYFIPLCMVFGIGISFFKGRKWCDWYCPRGSFFDSVINKISPNREIPFLFKNLKFRIIVLTILFTTLTLQIINKWPDPLAIGKVFVVLLSATSLFGIVMALIYHQRVWCYICPVGTLSNLAGKGKHPLKIDQNLCVDCKICNKNCPMQINPSSYRSQDFIANSDCLKCEICSISCPKKAIKFNTIKEK